MLKKLPTLKQITAALEQLRRAGLVEIIGRNGSGDPIYRHVKFQGQSSSLTRRPN